MKFSKTIAAIAAASLLAGCGGGIDEMPDPVRELRPQAVMMSGMGNLAGNRGDYAITRSGSTLVVTDGSGAISTFDSLQTLQFADVTLNLLLAEKARTLPAADLKLLMELYVAFFNRVPDADGLGYWIDQVKAGQSIDIIADSFYNAALEYSSLTGYAATMGNPDFVRLIYKNVLGRTAPPDADVQYWSAQLGKGGMSKGTLVRAMLDSAHSFANDTEWGWVPRLLDNKVAVAEYCALQQGLNYNTPSESIARMMAIAAAVTSTDTAIAKAMIGFADGGFDLTR